MTAGPQPGDHPVGQTGGQDGLRHRVFRGSVVMLGTTLGLRVLSLLSTVFLARMLDPSDFGVVALASLVLSTIELVAPLGLPAALIQRRLDRERATYQAFVVTVISGTIFSLLIMLNSGLIGSILGNQSVVPIMPWMALLTVLGALTRIPEGLLEKDMAFKKLSAVMIASDVAYICTALGLAYSGYGLWSLVFAYITKFGVSLVMSWTMTPGWDWITPKPWDSRLMKELLGYGVGAMGSRTVYFFFTNVDNFVVGRQLGTAALGVYAKAFDFTTKTVDNLNKTISTVLFPSYSRIQHDRERLSRGYLKSLRMIATVTVPLAAGIAVTAPELVPVVLGRKWAAMIPILQILGCMSIVKPISSTTAAVFNAMGHPAYNMRAGLVVTVVMLTGIYLLLFMGAEGVALAVLIAHVAGLFYNIYQIHTLLPGTPGGMLEAVTPTAISTAVMAAGVYLVKIPFAHLAGHTESWGALLTCVCVGVVLYAGMLLMFQRPLLQELRTLVFHREAPAAK